MAAGAGLVLVGAIGIGATADVSGLFGQAGAAFQNVGENLEAGGASDREAAPSVSAYRPAVGTSGTPAPTIGETRGLVDSAGSSQPPTTRFSPAASPGSDATEPLNGESTNEQPWLTLLIAGAGLLVISAALRFSLSPRAG
jgi:hypothetical protein